MSIRFIVTIVHNYEIVDWTWDSDPNSENYGEERPIYKDDPFYHVEVVADGFVRSYGELPQGKVSCDYKQADSLNDLKKIVPEYLFSEILNDRFVETLGL